MKTPILSDISMTASPRQVAPPLHGEAFHCKTGETFPRSVIQEVKEVRQFAEVKKAKKVTLSYLSSFSLEAEFNLADFFHQQCFTLGFIKTIRLCCQQMQTQQVMAQLPVSEWEVSTKCSESKQVALAYTVHVGCGSGKRASL